MVYIKNFCNSKDFLLQLQTVQICTTELIQINITCDHYLDLYVDGSLVSSDVYPNISKKIINVGSKVIAVNCRKRHRFFKSTEEWKNKVYSGSIMLTAATTSTLECALKCLGTPECGSFNYEFLRKEVQKCELNRGKSSSHINLVSRTGFQYFEIIKAGY
ncbi:hypothetical protein AC249_AIPGENE29021 [Exaiptasia diaphana]|nr:hypothetical protein AC249_AIPGENE29021 [Exaiptasia diaphana]